ncbi:hypothetical protein BS50DRAFT_260455 [Corynespora cassiicola Philippines]|uniref:BTB domain-containing protein n=1 Tax=Corynespora cassiicola Philippines TaxID=1448308 RepID=A0A2T2N1L2_CORCC|nr:hypothetical protein BS50DRAFT_260455 [Corynespora cassiicola Philippines]
MAFNFQTRAPSAWGPGPVLGALSVTAKIEIVHSEKLLGNIALYVLRRLYASANLMSRMFNDTKYSNATVRIHDVALPVHKVIVCIQSKYFEKAFREEFVELMVSQRILLPLLSMFPTPLPFASAKIQSYHPWDIHAPARCRCTPTLSPALHHAHHHSPIHPYMPFLMPRLRCR